jgi:hypothetical protein
LASLKVVSARSTGGPSLSPFRAKTQSSLHSTASLRRLSFLGPRIALGSNSASDFTQRAFSVPMGPTRDLSGPQSLFPRICFALPISNSRNERAAAFPIRGEDMGIIAESTGADHLRRPCPICHTRSLCLHSHIVMSVGKHSCQFAFGLTCAPIAYQ